MDNADELGEGLSEDVGPYDVRQFVQKDRADGFGCAVGRFPVENYEAPEYSACERSGCAVADGHADAATDTQLASECIR